MSASDLDSAAKVSENSSESAKERQRQQAVLAALSFGNVDDGALGLRESGDRAVRGIEAYRANAQAIAGRALAAAFKTVRALVGAEDFAQLAREFWIKHPPSKGDLGEWGAEFPAWLQVHHAMAVWPYLGDCARLDLALHRNERAADAVIDTQSLKLLESTDPSLLRISLMPGTVLLHSTWPIAAIYHAHQLSGAEAESAFDDVRQAVADRVAEQVLVARKGWRATVHRLDAPSAAWTQSLLNGVNLAAAIERAGEGFDFNAWLVTALRESWIRNVSVQID
jgi:hypothetical protein